MKIWSVAVVALCAVLAACQFSSTEQDAVSALASAPGDVGAERCRALAGTRMGIASIEKAQPVKTGDGLLNWWQWAIVAVESPRAALDMNAPVDFCRVSAKLRPVPGSEITAEVWLPQQWNGKLLGIGGFGLNGGLITAARTLSRPLVKGYIGLATDAGHRLAFSAKFVQESPDQYVDYAYRANHVAARFAKTLAKAYYDKPVQGAYFHGCSNGGRDALMEARRFPEDYDGIIAGAPAAGWSKLMSAAAWNRQAIQGLPQLEKKLKLVHDAVIARCDTLDGVKDGLLENPLDCPFDPIELQCTNGDGASCLNQEEVAALRKIYGGPRLRDGTQLYPGLPVGGEGVKGNWNAWLLDDGAGQQLLGEEAYRWMAYGDPEWELSRFDIERDHALAQQRVGPVMDSDDPDLSAFMRRGGKLLLYHGWNDAALPAGGTVEYHAALRKVLGPVADAQIRLFMVPGMLHCSGGPGPTEFEVLDHMDSWVKSGVAPERIVASEYDSPELGRRADAKVKRTRPLCPWPQVAHYSGFGSTDTADNFVCK